MPTREDLPHRTGPWASRFDTEEALVTAEEALRTAALRDHDLAPILPFSAVYGPGLASLDKATAIGIDPRTPYGADGEINYVHADFFTLGLVYGAYRPASGLPSGGPGPQTGDDLLNTTLYPYPGGPLDPTSVPLSDLGLDAPGVDRRFVHFCASLLGVEAVDDLGLLRETYDAAWPDYRATVRAGLLHAVLERPLTVEQWYGLTYVGFPDQDELTAYLAQVYAYLYEGFAAMPVAPA